MTQEIVFGRLPMKNQNSRITALTVSMNHRLTMTVPTCPVEADACSACAIYNAELEKEQERHRFGLRSSQVESRSSLEEH